MTFKTILLSAAIFALPTTAVALQPEPEATDAKEAEDAEKAEEATAEFKEPKRVCRNVKMTGTRVKKRICYSSADWRKQRENHQELADNLKATGPGYDINQGSGGGGPPAIASQQSRTIEPR